LDSKNGTHINGQPLMGGAKHRLQDGDEIQMALCVRLLFVGEEATLPLTLEASPPPAALPSQPGGLQLDKAQRSIKLHGRELDPPLSPPQFRLLELLYDAQARVVSRDQVIATVWPEAVGEGVSEQAIDALVRRLRDRLAELDQTHDYIVTVRGHGFKLDPGAGS
jgi:DNA-binding response OmpR family regulator